MGSVTSLIPRPAQVSAGWGIIRPLPSYLTDGPVKACSVKVTQPCEGQS